MVNLNSSYFNKIKLVNKEELGKDLLRKYFGDLKGVIMIGFK